MLIMVKSCVRDSYKHNFTFYLDYFPFLSSLRIYTFVSNAPSAQSVERGTNNAKVVCSRLIRTRFYFLFGLLSFKVSWVHSLYKTN